VPGSRCAGYAALGMRWQLAVAAAVAPCLLPQLRRGAVEGRLQPLIIEFGPQRQRGGPLRSIAARA